MSSLRPALLHRPLLAWYRRSRRRLPWRERPSPYRVWVSEIMLQQTTVAAALPRYRRFVGRFPSVRSLARAKEAEVLRSWAGLGYYSRARNLRRAAIGIVSDHGGKLPCDLAALDALPGVGPYTAAAIASIAFGKPHELVDGNVARVLARLFRVRTRLSAGATQKRLWDLAQRCLARSDPGSWNQALMELGALVCVPEGPRCGACPLSSRCGAFGAGEQDSLPKAGDRRSPVDVDLTALLVERGPGLLLWRRGPEERLLPGHWGLPERRHLPSAKVGKVLGVVRHSITHHRIALTVHAAELGRERLPARARWVRSERARELLVSSLWLKCLKLLGWTRKP